MALGHVGILKGLQVVFEFVRIEFTRTREQGEDAPLFRLDTAAKFAALEILIAREFHLGDLVLAPLADLVDHVAESRRGIAVDLVIDSSLGIAAFQVVLLERLAPFLDPTFIEDVVHLDLDFLLKAGVANPLVAIEADRSDSELGSNIEKQIDLIVLNRLQADLYVLEQLSSIQRANIAIDRDLVVFLSLAQRHIRARYLLVHIGQTCEIDDEFPNRRRFRLIRRPFVLRDYDRSHRNREQWEKEESDGTIPYNFQSGCILFGRLI